MFNVKIDENNKAVLLTIEKGDNRKEELGNILAENIGLIDKISSGDYYIIVDIKRVFTSNAIDEAIIPEEYYNLLKQFKFKKMIVIVPKNIFIKFYIKKMLKSIWDNVIFVKSIEEAYKHI